MFLFKHKTAYEMRISDWSSDVCSSDLPVVETQAMTAGNFLTGAFRLGAQIFDRQDARVEVSTEVSDNFRKNLVTILAEARLALAVYRTEAFIRGGFAAAITALNSCSNPFVFYSEEARQGGNATGAQ